MSQSVRISDDRYSKAQKVSLVRARSRTQPVATEVDGGLTMLKERQIKDAEEVAAGKRSARSLMVVGKGDLKGYRFTQNPASKFAIPGDGW